MRQRNVITKHFSPLRYPGGKGKLCEYIKSVIQENDLFDCHYVEPYAGGAAVAIELLAHEYALTVHINDVSRPIYAFWESVLERTDELCRLITDIDLSLDSWDAQRHIFQKADVYDNLELGFATFFLNRTNRSGILNGGVIGGREQKGKWGIDARFNREVLIDRIQMIGSMKERIYLTRLDALALIKSSKGRWKDKAFIYFDPPYYNKAKHLYYDFYDDSDHRRIAREVNNMRRLNWLVSYDNHHRIKELYGSCPSVTYDLGYSAREYKRGSEIMIFSPRLSIPSPSTNMHNFRIKAA